MPDSLELTDATFLNGSPSTFEKRGTTVPFTTPALQYARVRRGRDGGLEVLVDGFSGGRCVYVLPWAVIPDLFRLTLHDRALHAEISFSGAATPDRFRLAAYRVARSGLGGADMIELGRRTIECAADEQVTTKHHLLVRVIELTGLDVRGRALTLDYVNSAEGQAAVREAFRRLAACIGDSAQNCLGRIHELSIVLQPVGFDADGQRGGLRRLVQRLGAFRDAVACADLGAVSQKMAEVAQVTLGVSQDLFRSADQGVGDIVPFLVHWDAKVRALKADLERLSWLLDGWAYVFDLWDDAVAQGKIKPQRVAEIMRLLPIVPKSEFNATQAPSLAELAHPKSRRVLPNEDWRTGAFDEEMARRLERAAVAA
ncbi:hypothetical protein [Azospirillum sp. ST 5-10]|uniref:hypothetical protein n=1 Tax=unclassified Azospirillum TaxID=2630922 RepID=UPI003F4A0B9D